MVVSQQSAGEMGFAYKEFEPFHVFWVVLEVQKCLCSDDTRKPGMPKLNKSFGERSEKSYVHCSAKPSDQQSFRCVYYVNHLQIGDCKEWEGM